MSTLGRSDGYTVETTRPTRRIDFGLFLGALLLLGMGLLTLYSHGHQRPDNQFPKQVLNAAVGLVPFSIFAFVNPRFWMRIAPVVYVINAGVLLGVLYMGERKFGAQRWIDIGPMQFQPSEMAKLFTVLTLASFYAMRQDRIRDFSTFLLGIAHVAVPVALIFKQPHLGATMVLLVIWFCVSLAANVPTKFLGGTLAALVFSASMVLFVPPIRDKVLHGYQQGRIEALTKNDEKGADFQTTRAAIAFGVGGVTGTGFLKGEQKQMGFIPFQYNDFVFTVIGEEGGLVGSSLVLATFVFLFLRIWLVMLQATDPFYRMVAAGILAFLAFHTYINIGMNLGLLPVVGLWLPFFSAGGTALWLCMASIGLLLNIRSRERPVLFT